MGDMADDTMRWDIYDYEGRFYDDPETNDREQLAKLETEVLIAISIIYQEEGYIEDDSFPVKMVDFYNSRGFLTGKQRESLLNALGDLQTDEKVDELISVHLSEMEHQQFCQSLQKPYEPKEEKIVAAPVDTSEKIIYTLGNKAIKVVNSMSKYVTCREAKVSPNFSDCEKQYPYELDYLLVEFTGKPKKTYYTGSDIEVMTVYSKNWCVVSEKVGEGEYNGYICKDWDTAKALREHLRGD